MGLSWQEYWNGLPFPSLGDLPDPGTEPASPALAGRFFFWFVCFLFFYHLSYLGSAKGRHLFLKNLAVV